MNVTLEVANIYDLIFEEFYDLSDASVFFFLKRRELFLRTALMEVSNLYVLANVCFNFNNWKVSMRMPYRLK